MVFQPANLEVKSRDGHFLLKTNRVEYYSKIQTWLTLETSERRSYDHTVESMEIICGLDWLRFKLDMGNYNILTISIPYAKMEELSGNIYVYDVVSGKEKVYSIDDKFSNSSSYIEMMYELLKDYI